VTSDYAPNILLERFPSLVLHNADHAFTLRASVNP
jgi:hypothetical protein